MVKATIKEVQKLYDKDEPSDSTASRMICYARDVLGKTKKQIITMDEFKKAHGLDN